MRAVKGWRSLALAAAGALLSPAATLEVGTPGGYSTIGEALAAAGPGDEIVVHPGEYRERLRVKKPVRLMGRGMPHIRGDGSGDVVRILADDVELRGFRISGSGVRMMHSDAGIKVSGKRVRVAGNELFDNLFGIYLDGSVEAVIEHNRIRGRADIEVGRRGAGIHFYDAHHNIVRFNRIWEVRDGVYFDHSDHNRVEDNHFSDLRYGVHYMYCGPNSFSRNIFRDSMAGVVVMYTDRVVFRDNQIINNRKGFNACGLLFKDTLDSVAERNVIVNNARGIFLDNSDRNRFFHNLVAQNDVAVVLHANSLENSFGGNDFIDNLAVLHTVGRADADWTPGGLGNYYSDYTGYDLDGDGVGDVEYRLQDAFEYLAGNRPLLRLFLNSAAADALAFAEKNFPLIRGSDERDTAPRMTPVSGVKMMAAEGQQVAASRRWLPAAGWLLALMGSVMLAWRLRA